MSECYVQKLEAVAARLLSIREDAACMEAALAPPQPSLAEARRIADASLGQRRLYHGQDAFCDVGIVEACPAGVVLQYQLQYQAFLSGAHKAAAWLQGLLSGAAEVAADAENEAAEADSEAPSGEELDEETVYVPADD